MQNEDLSSVNARRLIDAGLGDYGQQLRAVTKGRRPLLTFSGCLGTGPREMEAGDLVYVVRGADVPCILRRGPQDDKLRLIEEAYVHGVMDGEVMKSDPVIEEIALC